MLCYAILFHFYAASAVLSLIQAKCIIYDIHVFIDFDSSCIFNNTPYIPNISQVHIYSSKGGVVPFDIAPSRIEDWLSCELPTTCRGRYERVFHGRDGSWTSKAYRYLTLWPRFSSFFCLLLSACPAPSSAPMSMPAAPGRPDFTPMNVV